MIKDAEVIKIGNNKQVLGELHLTTYSYQHPSPCIVAFSNSHLLTRFCANGEVHKVEHFEPLAKFHSDVNKIGGPRTLWGKVVGERASTEFGRGCNRAGDGVFLTERELEKES